MSKEVAIFLVLGGVMSIGYSLPKSIRAWREQQIKLPLIRPFVRSRTPDLFWFGFLSSIFGALLAAIFVVKGAGALLFQ